MHENVFLVAMSHMPLCTLYAFYLFMTCFAYKIESDLGSLNLCNQIL